MSLSPKPPTAFSTVPEVAISVITSPTLPSGANIIVNLNRQKLHFVNVAN